MAHWCESCGQQLPDGEVPSGATWLGEPSEPGDHQHSFTKPAGQKQSGREKKLLMAFVAALAVWGLFVGIGRIVTPDDAIDEQAAAEIEQDRLEREAAAESEALAAEQAASQAELEAQIEAEERRAARPQIAEVPGDYGAADAAPGFPDAATAETRVAVSVQVERLQRQLTRRDSAAFVAYRSNFGLVIIDLVGGRSVEFELAPGVTPPTANTRLLRSGESTFAVDPDTLDVSRVAQDSSIVVTDTLDGNLYMVDAAALAGQAELVEVVVDGEYTSHRLPAGGLQIQPIDGLGLLAVPKSPTGETFIAGAEDFSVLSENRVLTGTSTALLEQVCATEDQCALVVRNMDTDEENAVPASFVRFGDQYSLAPNGEALLRYTPEGFAEVYVAGTETILWVIGAGLRAPAWGPNSDYIVWIDRIGDPTLKVMFPDERDWLTIDLRDLGAPPPASAELIVFTSDISLADKPEAAG